MHNAFKYLENDLKYIPPNINGNGHLVDSPLNLLSLRESERTRLKKIISNNHIRGSKCIFVDSKIKSAIQMLMPVCYCRRLVKIHFEFEFNS